MSKKFVRLNEIAWKAEISFFLRKLTFVLKIGVWFWVNHVNLDSSTTSWRRQGSAQLVEENANKSKAKVEIKEKSKLFFLHLITF